MKIYMLFTTDPWKSYSSRMLRGVFTENTFEKLEKAKKELIKNKVVNDEDEIDIVILEDAECEIDGGYF